MKSLYLKFDHWFMHRAQRERWLLTLVALFAVAWFVWVLLLEVSQQNYAKQHLDYQEQLHNETLLLAELESLRLRLTENPNAQLQARLQRLNAQRQQLSQQLDNQANFMAPEQLLTWLDALMVSETGVRIEELTAQAPRAFFADASNKEVRVLQHPVTVKLSGDFYNLQAYFHNLARLPLGFYWQGFDYQVVKHPEASVTLDLFTLSYAAGDYGQ